MSSEPKYTGMAKLFAIEEKLKKEQASQVPQTSQVSTTRLVPETSLVSQVSDGWSETRLVPQTSQVSTASQASQTMHKQTDLMSALPMVKGYNKQYYQVIDHLYPMLDAFEQAIHQHLFRLSWGFNKPTCNISLPGLAKRAGMSPKSVQRTIAKLIQKGLIKKTGSIIGRGKEQGVEYWVAAPASLVTTTSLASETSLVAQTTNKDNTLKENTHTQERKRSSVIDGQVETERATRGVGVGSKFSIEECRKYAKHLRTSDQGITNPGGYATTIHRSGEADELIEKFLNATDKNTPQVDASNCVDCHGTGFWYPAGVEQGVAKCLHSKLTDTA